MNNKEIMFEVFWIICNLSYVTDKEVAQLFWNKHVFEIVFVYIDNMQDMDKTTGMAIWVIGNLVDDYPEYLHDRIQKNCFLRTIA